jgi:mannobiose 2-epimerase
MTHDAHRTIISHATRSRRRLRDRTLPYWLAVSRDDIHGGYLLRHDVPRKWWRRAGRRVLKGPLPPHPDDKQLVDQARLLWVFSHGHRKGFDKGHRCLRAASRGYRFLRESFLDDVHGGYVWLTDRTGRPVNPVKHLYGQAFVIFGFVEYARASGDDAALHEAISLHRTVEEQLRDPIHGGWREHGDGDWSAPAPDDPRIEVPSAGLKSANAAVHWMEALTELYRDTADDQVRGSLTEVLDLARRYWFPPDPARSREYRNPDWTLVDRDTPVSYGHNVEFAWLMIRAQRALGMQPSWDQLSAYLDHTLHNAFDDARGGVLASDRSDGIDRSGDKVWWVQYEMVAALAEALAEHGDERYARALAQMLTFIERHVVDRRDGVAFESVHQDGRRASRRKAGHWKAGYHEVRATVKVVDSFAA